MMARNLKEVERVGNVVEAILAFCQLSILWPQPQEDLPAVTYITPSLADQSLEFIEKGLRQHDSYVRKDPGWLEQFVPTDLKKGHRDRLKATQSAVQISQAGEMGMTQQEV